jgi:catechol 1,2-dioxygenase
MPTRPDRSSVTETLIGDLVRHDSGPPPAPAVTPPWYTLDYTFFVESGEAKLPRPAVSAKATEKAVMEW